MRTPIVAGNWKMHKTVEEARHLIWAMLEPLQAVEGVERIVCPPYTALLPVANLLMGTGIQVGAQNMHWAEEGAYTGEISPRMVAEWARYVILGHSERRKYFGETDDMVRRKVAAALTHDLTPIVCVGETLEQRRAGQTEAVVRGQLLAALEGLTPEQAARVVVAYEPVWAIGTGEAATPEDAQRVIGEVLRPALAQTFGPDAAQAVRILYGGSVKAHNAAGFFAQPDIDGALVGGASLDPEQFPAIAQAAADAAPAP
ncbi:MAG: triose-phosphate isomerase [Chloroflexi bacterium]|nr:triose-phosphate isomerase [Chloroflexota bacterium]